ncbi:hypothetical protein Pelo_9316 [Pelomyxa schiedti]|nr:hypothetical protein Pelo_9316 [Pelomyxa schiedti]
MSLTTAQAHSGDGVYGPPVSAPGGDVGFGCVFDEPEQQLGEPETGKGTRNDEGVTPIIAATTTNYDSAHSAVADNVGNTERSTTGIVGPGLGEMMRAREPWKDWTADPVYMFERWHPLLRDLALGPSYILTLKDAELKEIAAKSVCFSMSDSTSLRDLISSSQVLSDLEARIDSVLSPLHYGFVKLSTRSPKDAVLFDFERISSLLELEIQQRYQEKPFTDEDSLEEISEDNWIIFFRAVCKAVRVEKACEALSMILSSRRCFHDASWSLFRQIPLHLIISAWEDSILPEWEFRAFVFHNRLTSCTQYTDTVFIARISSIKEQIRTDIFTFWSSKVKPRLEGIFPGNTYTIDFAYIPESRQILIIEINDPPPIANSSLYNWEDPHDRAIIESGTEFDFRVLSSSPMNPKSSREAIPQPLWSYIMRSKEKYLRSLKRKKL